MPNPADKPEPMIVLHMSKSELIEVIDQRLEEKLEEKLEQKLEQKLTQRFNAFRLEMNEEFARHTNAIIEAIRGEIRALDDQYRALPGEVGRHTHQLAGHDARLTTLEAGATRPKRTRRSSRSSP
jgi:hypothetical protein